MLFFWTFYSSKEPEKNSTQLSSTENQNISMISEGSCDTEDWSKDAENSALKSQK